MICALTDSILPDKVKVVVIGWIVEVHLSLFFVVSGNFEWNNFELVHAWSH